MSSITLDSHDLLGKLSIVKNYLSVVSGDTLTVEQKKYIQQAAVTTEALIALVKEKTVHNN